MLSTVVIDIPVEVAAETAAVATARCQQVLGSGRCRLQRESGVTSEATYHARVSFEGADQSVLRIVFSRAAPMGAPAAERSLAFSQADAAESRWASVGLVVAGLVTDFDKRDSRASPAVPPVPAKTQPIRPAASPPKPALGLDAGVMTGPALEERAWRVGALVRGWYGFASNQHVIAVGGLRYSGRFEEPTLRWASLSAGLGSRFGSSSAPLSVGLVGEVVGERVMLSASEPETGRSESAHQHRFGGRLGVDVALRMTRHVGIVFGAEASALTPSVRVVVQDELVGREPSARFAVWSGLRLTL
jgi:hypothetical protein